MTYWLVETYTPAAADLSEAVRRAGVAATTGRCRLVQSIAIPSDETCFLLYQGASATAVAEAATRGGVDAMRIVAAVPLPGEDRRVIPSPQRSEQRSA